jgi:hypothetical protein
VATVGDGVRCWDAATGRSLYHLPDRAWALAFSPDGLLLAIADSEGASLHDAATGAVLGRLHDVGEGACDDGLTFSPDGERIVLVGAERIGVWGVASGRRLRSFPRPFGKAKAAAFAPNGRRFVCAGADDNALVWGIPPLPGEERLRGPLTPRRVERLWAELADADPLKAHQAFRELRPASRSALAALGERMRPPDPPNAGRVARLIEELDSDDFDVREAASDGLKALGDRVEARLRAALKEPASLEQKGRLERLLDGLATSAERRRALWAVRLLELNRGREARLLLSGLIDQAPDSALAERARDALERLK